MKLQSLRLKAIASINYIHAQLFILLLLFTIAIVGCSGYDGVNKYNKTPPSSNVTYLDQVKIDSFNSARISRQSEPSPLASYLPKGGSLDSVMYYYLNSSIEKKYELWAKFGNNVLNPYTSFDKDPDDTYKTISITQKDPISGQVFNRINFLDEDNPFIKEGFKLFKRDDTYLYFELPNGNKTNKITVKKYLPSYLYDSIPQILGDGQFVSNNWYQTFQNGYVITSHTFEVEGVNREWIHGDYATSRHLIYNPKGVLVFDYFGDTEDVNVEIDPTGSYVLIRKNYNGPIVDLKSNTKSSIEIYDLNSQKLVFEDQQKDSEWNRFIWNEFGLSIIGCYSPMLSDPLFKEVKTLILNPFNKSLYILQPQKKGVKFVLNKNHYYFVDPSAPQDTIRVYFSDIKETLRLN